MPGGKKRKRPEKKVSLPASSANNSQHSKQQKGGSSSSKSPSKTTRMDADDWITNLAKQSTEITNSSTAKTKEARKETRALKQLRRQERMQQKSKRKDETMEKKEEDDDDVHEEPLEERTAFRGKGGTATTSSNAITTGRRTMSLTTIHNNKKRLKTLSVTVKQIIKELHKKTFKMGKHGAYREPLQPFDATTAKKRVGGSKSKFKQWAEENIQPRPRDYGGLGLALPSLWLPFADPSFSGRLEEEFQQHIDGFFGKQRTKAMKKQLDGNMLWRQLDKARTGSGGGGGKGSSKSCKSRGKLINMSQKINGKKLSDMTPDERVEAMIKAGLL